MLFRRSVLFSLLCLVTLPVFPLAGTGSSLQAQQVQDSPRSRFDEARTAWDLGRYVEALEELERLLAEARDDDELLGLIALLTGELYAVTELTTDGRAVRWAPDGLRAAYETGTGADATTRVLELRESGLHELVSVSGTGLVFAPAGAEVAYLAVSDTEEVRAARARLQREMEEGDRMDRLRLMREMAELEARHTEVAVRDLVTGRENRFRPRGVVPSSLLYGPDGALYLLGGREGAEGRLAEPRSDVYRVGVDGTAEPVTRGPGLKTDPFFAGGGAFLVYGAGRGLFAVEEMASGEVRMFEGGFPAVSADEGTLAFLGEEEGRAVLRALSLSREGIVDLRTVNIPYPVLLGSTRACPSCPLLSGLALAPGGEFAVFQAMPREDWELFQVHLTAEAGASDLVRVTREIQHDVFPMVLGDGRLLAMKGESRHRRSHLYDLETGQVTRLFRNNTVRTLAPEYEWAPSPDGSKLLIVAERDGNTISPERGVYLMDLGRQVTRDEVIARVRENLASELDLRARAEAMYGAMSAEIQEVMDRVSKTLLFDYQEALFQFGSKFITQPGNRLAIHYLEETLRSFGYEPELQWFEARGVETANVIARLPGSVSPDVVYAVSAHFDSTPQSPGADDNNSGTAGLLEMARILAGRPMPATIEIAFFTGEEAGLLGSREYVRRARESGKNLVGALNNDMVGFAVDHRLNNTIRYSNQGIRDLQHGAAILFSDLVTYDTEYYRGTDAAAFYEGYGDIVGGIGSYPILANPHYHQVHDVLATVNHDLVAEVAKVTTASIMLMASSPSRIKGLDVVLGGAGTAEVTWEPAPEADVTEYLVAHGPEREPWRSMVTVQEPRLVLEEVQPGDVISVRAVNRRGLQGWDWARVRVP